MLETLILDLALVGPPAPPEPRAESSKVEEPRKHWAAWAGPVAGSIIGDLWTTQRALGFDGKPAPGGKVWVMKEQNRLPGMGTFGGRVAWMSVEGAAITWALKSESKRTRVVGKVAAVVSMLVHSRAAWLNEKHRQEILKAR